MHRFPKTQKVFLETYGCQMNEYDSELIRSILTKENYSFVQNELEADIVMLNTCAIRENAHRKVYGRVHDIYHKRKEYNKLNQHNQLKVPVIGILGCMATNLRKDLLENRNLNIDFIAGPDSYKRLPKLIEECFVNDTKPFDVTLSEFETYSDILPIREKGLNAWIAVMRGCNNFCSFCVVPYTRGRERSRSPQNIVEEVKRLADEGFKQVTLLGQNVNSYYHEGCSFAGLLNKVSKVEGIKRIRFTSPHPKDFPESLLYEIAENPKVCKHVHLPAQSGNDCILDLMIRTYTRREYVDLVDKVRQIIPNVTLTTDMIVGFPTETDTEFNDTKTLMEEVRFDAAFIFKYSERKNTIASQRYPDDISEEKKTERAVLLNDIQKKISLERNHSLKGNIERVFVERLTTPRSPDDIQGRADSNKIVIFPAKGLGIGDEIDVKISDATANVLKGRMVPSAEMSMRS